MTSIIPFRVERWMSAYEQGVAYNLAESSVRQLRLGQLLDLAEENGDEGVRRRLEDLVLTYDETPGTAELRGKLAAIYGVGPDEVLVTCGAIEANYLLFRSLVKPGDVVVSVFPAYQQLYSMAEMCGAEVRLWKLDPGQGFRPDLEALRRLIDGRVRLIVLNTPHNPTGAVLDEAALRTILGWAGEVGARVLSDETYFGVTLQEGDPVPPPARSLDPRAVSVSTTSKNIGLAGLRIGWIVGTADLVEKCWSYRDYTSISCSRLSDALACVALDLRDRLLDRCRKIARRNLEVISDFMARHQEHFEFIPPRGGLLTFPRLRREGDSRAFCRRLIEDQGVLLVPGWAFEMEGHVRIGIGEGPEVFDPGLERLGRFLDR